MFSTPCPPFFFTYFFHNSFLGVPNLNFGYFGQFISDDVVHAGSSHLYTNFVRVVFLICSFILLNKNNTASHHPTPLNSENFTRNRTGKFTDLKVTWERPSVKPGKAIHDASWAKSSEASKGESLNVHRIHVFGIIYLHLP